MTTAGATHDVCSTPRHARAARLIDESSSRRSLREAAPAMINDPHCDLSHRPNEIRKKSLAPHFCEQKIINDTPLPRHARLDLFRIVPFSWPGRAANTQSPTLTQAYDNPSGRCRVAVTRAHLIRRSLLSPHAARRPLT
ncbi:hypothetical protein EVAR_27886_1 [Eumeta japonica]|uniref:Uncharacterized protein n=1 Tax=Eumeta variegata TaxID=151549 RepID=A0A4C1UWW4_EUMVA|nr:hypothetical protein EVAR_27886_1 [Eumeta japonica]